MFESFTNFRQIKIVNNVVINIINNWASINSSVVLFLINIPKKVYKLWYCGIKEEKWSFEFFYFFEKKSIFFKFWKSPEKNTSKSCFFWKDDSISKWFKMISHYFLRFLNVLTSKIVQHFVRTCDLNFWSLHIISAFSFW